MMKIGQVVQALAISADTLRYYENRADARGSPQQRWCALIQRQGSFPFAIY